MAKGDGDGGDKGAVFSFGTEFIIILLSVVGRAFFFYYG